MPLSAMRRLLCFLSALVVLMLLGAAPSAAQSAEPADLILTNATFWTGDETQPRAEALAVKGERILAVGSAAEVEQHRAAHTEVLDLEGRFVVPGFIDNHTHFNSAGALLLGINLLDVNDEEGLVGEVRAARDRLPEGAWITGGDWGAYAQWERGSEGAEAGAPREVEFTPHRDMVDDLTPETPVLLSRWDGEVFLANTLALERAELACGMVGVICEGGEMTGVLEPEAARAVREVIPEKSMEQRLAEAEAALERLRLHGVTTIHDITPPDQMRVFQQLRDEDRLTTRIYARPTLDKWEDLAATGITHGFGDDWLQVGGLKGFVDGILGNSSARFYEPYEHIDERGIWRQMMDHPDGGMQALIIGADAAGHWPQIHAIGDQAIDTLLTMYEQAIEVNGPGERRWRVIHTQHLRGPETARRMAELDLIAEVQPVHAIDDMRWVEERVGSERARWTYAFGTLHEAGVTLSFGSDWPGTNAAWYTADPLTGIYAAVTRQTVEGRPEGGWFPEERIDVETALRAYTVNNAYAAGQEDNRGRLARGLLADLVVLSEDIFEIAPEALLDVEVRYTIVGGEVVYAGE